MPKSNWIIIIIVVLVLAGAGIYFLGSGSNQALAPESSAVPTQNNPASETPTVTGAPSESQTSSPATNEVKGATVTYTDSGYSPATLTVKAGTTVTFVNQSSGKIWTASDPHPVHNGYPTTGGCRTSTFDECRGDAPGSSWSFKFDIKGTWGYHNHLNSGMRGTIVVQ